MRIWVAALISATLWIVTAGVNPAHGQNADGSAITKKEIPSATAQEIQQLELFLRVWPNDPSAQFNLALDYATIGLREEAIGLLEKMAEARTGLDPTGGIQRGFKSIAEDPRFRAVAAQVRKENPAVVGSTPAYVIHEKDLAPE